MKKIKSVFWDLDGTLADTELNGHRLAFNSAFDEFDLGWVWDIPTYIDLLKVSGGRNRIRHYSKLLKKELSKQKIYDIHLEKQSQYIKLIKSNKIKLRTGVNRLVNEIKSNNIQQYIVTTSSKKTTINLLKSLFSNYSDYFNDIITSEDVQRLKPFPDAYEKALYNSESTINDSIAIEDSLIGLSSTSSINLKCIITLSPWINTVSRNFDKAALVVDHLGDINLPSNAFKGNLVDDIVNLDLLYTLLFES